MLKDTQIELLNLLFWGSLFNYHHPGSWRVWKVGSELQSTTLDPLDRVDPVDPVLCPKVWFRVRETILFTLWPAPRPGCLPGCLFEIYKIYTIRSAKHKILKNTCSIHSIWNSCVVFENNHSWVYNAMKIQEFQKKTWNDPTSILVILNRSAGPETRLKVRFFKIDYCHNK